MTLTRSQFAWLMLGILAAALTISMLAAVIWAAGNTEAIRQVQQSNTSTLKSAEDAAAAAERATDRIEECTTPGRPCYDQGQKRTAEIIGDLNRVIAYAAACADKAGVQNEAEIYACVIDLVVTNDDTQP